MWRNVKHCSVINVTKRPVKLTQRSGNLKTVTIFKKIMETFPVLSPNWVHKSGSPNRGPQNGVPNSGSPNRGPQIGSTNRGPQIGVPKTGSPNRGPQIGVPKSGSPNQGPQVGVPHRPPPPPIYIASNRGQ
jgi:hypothetical protein